MTSTTARYDAQTYLRYRPEYPRELFQWLASVTKDHVLAWDCATGTGQSARGLVAHYRNVIATDIDQNQLDQVMPHPQITCRLSPAEQTFIESCSVDLVTVGCAVHWFDRNKFYHEVKRVLVPAGIIAVWTYEWPWTGHSGVDEVLQYYKNDVLGDYWLPNSRLYFERYQTLEFPFDELTTPSFYISCEWGAEDVLAFLSTWVGPQRYMAERKEDPTEAVRSRFVEQWNKAGLAKGFKLPLYLRVGRNISKGV